MKRLHQLLAGLMAIAMVAAMTVVPAFAEGENTDGNANQNQEESSNKKTYTYTSRGYIADTNGIDYLPVTSIYALESAGLRPVGEFTYTLEAATVPNTTENPAPVVDGQTVQSGLKFNNGEDGGQTSQSSVTVKFDSESTEKTEFTETKIAEIDLTKVALPASGTGVYRYTLSQKTALKNGNGTYSDDVQYTVDLYVSGGKITYIKVKNGDDKVTPVYTNTIKNTDALYVTNFIDYDMARADETFEFQVTIPDKGIGETGIELDVGTPIYATITSQDGSHEDREFTFYVVKNGETTYTETIKNEDGTETTVIHDNKVKLYDGDKLTIPGLPVNMKYTVTMVDANDYGYTSTREEYEGFTSTLNTPSVWKDYAKIDNSSTTEETIDHEGKVLGTSYTNNLGQIHHVEYVSTKDVAATGVTMDTVPYAVMFLAAAGLVVLSLAKKKINR
jgi:hypothetical protein